MMNTTEIEFPYGKTSIKAKIPTDYISCILDRKEAPGLENEAEAITAALRSPTGSAPLCDRIKKTDKVVVIVTDYTRPCPDDRILPPLLAELERKVPRENITIVVALGLHPPLDKQGMIEMLGGAIVENYNVLNHDVNNTVYIGTTKRGTKVDIDTKVMEADFRISTGFIEPHFFAGFSGGRKSIAPGVFSVRSAYGNHSYEMIEHPNTRAGILKGNQLHEDLVEQAKMADLNFIVNVLLSKDREITHVVAGDFIKAHERGCEIERALAAVKVDHKVDVTIATNSGAPLDLDLYQSCKGIDVAAEVTRAGGIIILASACYAGVGPPEFLEVHAACKRPIDVLQKIKREQPLGVQWENQVLSRTQLKNDIYMVSDLEDKIVRDMMITPIRSIEEGLEKAFKVLGNNVEIIVMPQGPLILPLLQH